MLVRVENNKKNYLIQEMSGCAIVNIWKYVICGMHTNDDVLTADGSSNKVFHKNIYINNK